MYKSYTKRAAIGLVERTLRALEEAGVMSVEYVSPVKSAQLHVLKDRNKTVLLNTVSSTLDISPVVLEGFTNFDEILAHVKRYKLFIDMTPNNVTDYDVTVPIDGYMVAIRMCKSSRLLPKTNKPCARWFEYWDEDGKIEQESIFSIRVTFSKA